jgi:CDP-2,3-bis-(O-geranylgeranyl)-sn-glycerol synthase
VDLIGQLAWHFQLIFPAMAANGAPVVAARYMRRTRPIDFGLHFIDKRRVFGDGKTWEGFASGLLAGLVVSALISVARGDPYFILVGAASSLGALLGDLAGSFLKRRLGMERGAPAPLLDQLDFYAGAVAMLYLVGAEVSLQPLAILAVVILALHLGTNYIAYRLGIKPVPW